MDISKIKVESKYLGGMTFSDHATREYSYEIMEGEFKGTVLRKSIYTPRKSYFEWGTQKDKWFVDVKEHKTFKTVQETIDFLVKSKINIV